LRELKYNEIFKEFTHEKDYLPYVDGKPRYKGVESFLKSRKIGLPWGDTSDSPDSKTICGLGNRKNSNFNEILAQGGVEVYESTVEIIKTLKKINIKLGVASSSKNCKPVLEAAGLLELFGTRVDGVVSAKLNLKGKPEPDIFTTACNNLQVDYSKAIIVEDAVSGVQAGKKGNFGLVLGIAREDNEKELLTNGANMVISDFKGYSINDLSDWFNMNKGK
ncbi:MAG: HAD-IA family hydrolase, partial [Spirochaetales bacterium]|nr:HAD-IA family hydrolase [Spirochaetales bacterium]